MSYNCWDYLAEAISSLHFVNAKHEVIVVDNHSSDGTPEKLSQQFPHVQLISNKFNAGFSAANNHGFNLSKGNIILLLNPDAKLINSNLFLALEVLSKTPKAIIGPKLINPDGSLQESVFEIANPINIFKEAFFLSYVFKSNQAHILKGQFGLSGACLLLRRDLYEQLGGLDPQLFWMEDIDFCTRAKAAGNELIYLPKWEVMHYVGQSGKKNYKVAIANQLISKLKYLYKHKKYLAFILSSFFIQIHIVLRMLLFACLSPFKPIYRHKFFAYIHSQSLFLKYIFTGKKETF